MSNEQEECPKRCPECDFSIARVFIDTATAQPTDPPTSAYCTSDYCSWRWTSNDAPDWAEDIPLE